MKKILLASAALAMFATTANADMFDLHISQTSSGIDETHSFESVIDIFDHYKDGSLDTIFNNYDKTSAATGDLNFRGIQMTLAFDGSGNLTFTIPNLGVNENFNGGNQETSFNLFKDYLKSNQDGLLRQILKSTVADTPYDMVAGNPNSLMNTMMDGAFQRGGGGVLGNFVSYISPDASTHHFKFQGQNKKATVYTLPIAKSFQFDNGSALMFDMPVSYTDMDNSKVYSAQIGLGYKIPVIKKENFKWNLTPGFRIGAIGSEDMLSGGLLYTGTLTSNAQWKVNSMTYGLTNMVGYIRDYSIKVADYQVDYDLKNMVYKNGVSVDHAINDRWHIGSAYSYTFYKGSELFIDDYHDVNVSLTRELDKGSFFSSVALVANYSFDGEDYYAYRIGINFQF